MPQITYTGTFKVIQQIVDWINNFTPSIGGLDDLTDVDISSPQNDEVLKYNSTTQKWENGTGGGSSGGHTIVDPNGTSMPQENKLQFTGAVSVSDDSTNGQTVVNVSGGGSSTLAGLTDVTLNSPNDSEVLFYDAATSKWINGTIASLPKIYSATEREVGCWTNGKPIYQKTVKFLSQALASGDNDLSLGISTIETVVDSKAMITNSAHTTYRPLNTWTTASSGQLFYLIEPSSGKLRVHTEGTWTSPNIFITLQYTKITS